MSCQANVHVCVYGCEMSTREGKCGTWPCVGGCLRRVDGKMCQDPLCVYCNWAANICMFFFHAI